MSLFALALAAALSPKAYDCTLDLPTSLYRSGDKADLNAIGLPPGFKWNFGLNVVTSKTGVRAEISWPDDPMQIAGKFTAVSTAKGSIAFATSSAGPCLFTEAGCMALVQVADQLDGSVKIIVTPAALASDSAKDTRLPFLVVAEGKCVRKGQSQ